MCLTKALKTEYRIQGRKSLERLEGSIAHLDKVFSNMRAMEINTARVVYMTEELKSLLLSQWEERKASGILSPYVFPNEARTNRIVKTRFNRAWRSACKKAGYPGKLYHDLRRTAVRNMVRADIPESGEGGHDDFRPQDPEHFRPLQYRGRQGLEAGGGKNRRLP